MKKVLSVIFIFLCFVCLSSCTSPSHKIDEIAGDEFEKIGVSFNETVKSAMFGKDEKAFAFFLSEGDEDMCIVLELDVKGENSYSLVTTHFPDKLYDQIYVFYKEEISALFVCNEDCSTVVIQGTDGNRVDSIRKSSYPYMTAEDGEKTFLCYDENMKELEK
ncbi:MAG: hypothetical protein IKM61_06190 [Eubacteriaceae bacterium]|nr:hypothetical protein [Eubacteriaceae bacterium]